MLQARRSGVNRIRSPKQSIFELIEQLNAEVWTYQNGSLSGFIREMEIAQRITVLAYEGLGVSAAF